jgi:hypothetical protein
LDGNVDTMQGLGQAAPAASAGSALTAVKPAYPPPAPVPTQAGPKGVRFDFNEGCRVALPEAEHPWRVRISDLDTGNILYETEIKAGRVSSTKRYYVRFRIDVWQQGEPVFNHEYSTDRREVRPAPPLRPPRLPVVPAPRQHYASSSAPA